MRIPATRLLTLCAIMLPCPVASASPPEAVTRPDLNGTRVRAPGTARVYLIDNGFRRAVPREHVTVRDRSVGCAERPRQRTVDGEPRVRHSTERLLGRRRPAAIGRRRLQRGTDQ